MEQTTNNIAQAAAPSPGFSRRKFFGIGRGIAGLGILATLDSCKKDDDDSRINLGSGDIGILNYAYALEQLEAAFYVQVCNGFFVGATDQEKSYLSDIRDHEVAHREFFKLAIGTAAIPGLTPNFTSIDFSNRVSVLGAAKSFEDLGVSAYNGAGKLITSPDYLTLAGKIVSVEARHAALIRDLITAGSFADNTVLDSNALDTSRDPKTVLSMAGV